MIYNVNTDIIMTNHLITLNIECFGPIKQAEVTFDKYTVLIGEQGSGKSTIAKLFSMFLWLEKALMRKIVSVKYITQYSRFQKNYCSYHRLENYFSDKSYLRFQGLHYNFVYQEGQISIETKEDVDSFHVAKVMYVPAERNFLSSIDNTNKLKELPPSLQTFLEEFENAKEHLKNEYKFPFGEVCFEYDSLNKISWVKGSDYRVRLSEASSGYQSVLPLILVSNALSQIVQNQTSQKGLDQQAIKQINREIGKIMKDESLTDDIKIAMARIVSSRFTYSHFVNIVEELEQNLYPKSQMATLYELLGYANCLDMNRILLTTHSPYLMSYLSLAVKAWQLCHSYSLSQDELDRVYSIVPKKSFVDPSHLRIYDLKDGYVSLLNKVDGIPSDDNSLNTLLDETNVDFDRFLEIEEEIIYDRK